MGLFDWLKRRPGGPTPPEVRRAYREAGDMVVDDGRGHTARATLSGATAVRIVPLMGGNPHAATGGYQVALRYSSGDAALGTPLADWRLAHELAQRVCEVSELPLDEMTERMFSRVDQASSKPEG